MYMLQICQDRTSSLHGHSVLTLIAINSPVPFPELAKDCGLHPISVGEPLLALEPVSIVPRRIAT